MASRPLLGVPFANIDCPRCGAVLTIPLMPNSTRRLGCPMCGALIECSVDRQGRIGVSSTTMERVATDRVMEEARRSIEGFKGISGSIFCPGCGADVSSAEINKKTDERSIKAYTLCPKCGREIEWASVPLWRPF